MDKPVVFLALTPLAVAGLVVWLFGAGGYDDLLYGPRFVENRTAFWKATVARELPLGASQAQIRQWALKRALPVYASDQGNLEIDVQHIPWHQIVCKEWNIIAEFTLQDDKSTHQDVVSMGACL